MKLLFCEKGSSLSEITPIVIAIGVLVAIYLDNDGGQTNQWADFFNPSCWTGNYQGDYCGPRGRGEW